MAFSTLGTCLPTYRPILHHLLGHKRISDKSERKGMRMHRLISRRSRSTKKYFNADARRVLPCTRYENTSDSAASRDITVSVVSYPKYHGSGTRELGNQDGSSHEAGRDKRRDGSGADISTGTCSIIKGSLGSSDPRRGYICFTARKKLRNRCGYEGSFAFYRTFRGSGISIIMQCIRCERKRTFKIREFWNPRCEIFY